MEQLFDAIRSVVDAGINQDWSQLASGIAGIVENGVSIISKLLVNNIKIKTLKFK